jgi:uncharacterized membrane protein
VGEKEKQPPRFSWKRCLYPKPEPLPHTPLFWLAMGLVTFAVALFCVYFISYLTLRHDAFLTNAEDLGIMDQAIWNTLQGNWLHQTVCNVVSDTNCYSEDGIMRFAIHVEPILFPVAAIYALWPSPKTLLILQTLVVGSGAFPAFWLARLRFRNELAAVGIALLYLLYPAQQQATVFDFHAVTLTASLLLFTLYFLYTRQTLWMFAFAILSMACKEEISLTVVVLGLWSVVFQYRWRSGLGLTLLGLGWFFVIMRVIMPYFSPTGQPMLIGRYGELGDGPIEILETIILKPKYIFDHYLLDEERAAYLQFLVSPAGYLPVLAPWILLIAGPAIALNVLSSQSGMYSGLFQYNAEIVPFLIFATIEGIVVLLWLAKFLLAQGRKVLKGVVEHRLQKNARVRQMLQFSLLSILVCCTIFTAVRSDYWFHGHMPFSIGFSWPVASTRSAFGEHFVDLVPDDATVSAQTALVPHLSQRERIYLFPYGTNEAQYILLDIHGDVYPFADPETYLKEVKAVLATGEYGVVAAQDGYILLKRGLPPPAVSPLPADVGS